MAETGENTPFPADILVAAKAVLAACKARGWVLGPDEPASGGLGTAESCTGGLVAGALTSIAGSSAVVSGGFVTYSDAAKTRLLGVPADLIVTHGAVSAPVAQAMAWGALDRGALDVAVALTGIAGPDGGSGEKPVGLVHFAVGWRDSGETRVLSETREYGDLGRDGVRMAAVRTALELLLKACKEDGS